MEFSPAPSVQVEHLHFNIIVIRELNLKLVISEVSEKSLYKSSKIARNIFMLFFVEIDTFSLFSGKKIKKTS